MENSKEFLEMLEVFLRRLRKYDIIIQKNAAFLSLQSLEEEFQRALESHRRIFERK